MVAACPEVSWGYRASRGQSGLVFAVEEAPEGGCTTRALGESIGSEADDLQSLRDMVRDALLCHFEEAERPRVFRLHLVRDEVLAVRGCHVT